MGIVIEEPTCPECRAGKCSNCDGQAWDFERDEPTTCACFRRQHEPPGEMRTQEGTVITDQDMHEWAIEAERGYDVSDLRRREP